MVLKNKQNYMKFYHIDDLLLGSIESIALSNTKGHIVVANSAEVAVWDYPKKTLQHRITKFQGNWDLKLAKTHLHNYYKGISQISTTFDGEYIIMGLQAGKVIFNNTSDFKKIHTFNLDGGISKINHNILDK